MFTPMSIPCPIKSKSDTSNFNYYTCQLGLSPAYSSPLFPASTASTVPFVTPLKTLASPSTATSESDSDKARKLTLSFAE